MKKICVYGKGGIGKSTTVTNVAAAMANMGLKVAVVGCDPKADTTRCLTGRRISTVLDRLKTSTQASMAVVGYGGILCMESGGPEPGTGCAGRGIASALREIQQQDLLADPDVVIYDVLGDVVCGGFSMPLRETWESDGNQGWKDGVPGRKKEIREIKKPFREPAWGQPEEPGGGTKDSGIKNGVSGA